MNPETPKTSETPEVQKTPGNAESMVLVPVGPASTVAPSRARRRLMLAVPAVLAACAIAAAGIYTKLTVDRADRTVPTTLWAESTGKPADDPAGDVARGRHSTPLSKLLLPVPSGYRLGPDMDAYGNDSEIGGKEAAALIKDDASGMSAKQRREFGKRVDRMGVQGVAMRSFVSEENDLVIEVSIVRMKDKKRIHDLFALKKELADVLEFDKGPAIKGHKKSACFLLPEQFVDDADSGKERKSKLAGMSCSAYDSELHVSVTAYGTKPFDKSAVAELVKKQLDHIASPGEYV
ncbi:hypothetical protein [Streptomyces sp. NPDC127084]|uniref:hypothetical protein n=1 Tax=Streptomyces sp. NPDC127084 TaxID=3347133 RepID=UPI0036697A31